MTNLTEKIQNLIKNTSSADVKLVCESFLNEANSKNIDPSDDITNKLYENLKKFATNDILVSNLLNEKEETAKSISNIEMNISKRAAQRLSENWEAVRRDKNVTNVGNHVDNTMINENIRKAGTEGALLEKLTTLSSLDASAKNYVEKAELDNYFIKESIEKIKGSSIANHVNLKYVLAKFESRLLENAPEYSIAKDFLSQISRFQWDPVVKTYHTKITEAINSRAAVIEVQNAVSVIKATDTKRFYGDIVAKMNEWIYSDNRNVHDLIKEMKSYLFNPYVKELSNNLLLMENSKGTTFNIPVKTSNCSVDKIYSPVLVVENGQVFKAGKNFYNSTEKDIVKLTEEQINALPTTYLELCENFFNSSVKVVNDKIIIYAGKTKVHFGDDKRAYINEREVEASTLGTQLLYATQQTVFSNSSNTINSIVNLFENVGTICDIDYGKSITSTVFEGVGVYLFKKESKIFINKFNSSMNENSFVEANALQTVNLVKEFLSFNMSESLTEFLEGDYKKKAEMETSMRGVLENVSLIESELENIEAAILEDPSIGDVSEITEAKSLLESELNKLKSKWQTMNSDLKKFEFVNEDHDSEEDDNEEEKEEEEETEKEEVIEVPAETDVVVATAAAPEEVPVLNAEPSVPQTAVTTKSNGAEIVDNGLAGAEGVQPTEIKGNDNVAATANVVDPALTGNTIASAGFAGAEGTQKTDDATHSEVIKQTVAEVPVITPGLEAPVITGEVSKDVEISVTPENGKEVVSTEPIPTVDALISDEQSEKTEKKEDKKEETEETNESKTNESIGVDAKVKDTVSGKMGCVTAINDEMFTVLLDGGDSVERKLSELEDVKAEVDEIIAGQDTEGEDKKPEDAVTTDDETEANVNNENETGTEGEDVEKDPATFVKATMTLDLGPFKAGDEVEIDAANYTSSGEDDPIKLKDMKDGVSEIPKKYLSVIEIKTPEGEGAAEAEMLKNLKSIETFLNAENTNGSKAIDDAKAKIKEFVATLAKGEAEEEKTETEEETAA